MILEAGISAALRCAVPEVPEVSAQALEAVIEPATEEEVGEWEAVLGMLCSQDRPEKNR